MMKQIIKPTLKNGAIFGAIGVAGGLLMQLLYVPLAFTTLTIGAGTRDMKTTEGGATLLSDAFFMPWYGLKYGSLTGGGVTLVVKCFKAFLLHRK